MLKFLSVIFSIVVSFVFQNRRCTRFKAVACQLNELQPLLHIVRFVRHIIPFPTRLFSCRGGIILLELISATDVFTIPENFYISPVDLQKAKLPMCAIPFIATA